MTDPIWLASNSPRRIRLLNQLGVSFRVLEIPPELDVEANFQPKDDEPPVVACRLALAKNQAARSLVGRDAVVLTADTIVTLGNHLFGKPNTHAQARDMLRQLSGKSHHVITAVCLSLSPDNFERCYGQTQVTFKHLTEQEIERYLNCCHVMDKAGGYAIQELAATFIKTIHGNYSTVVGLPLFELGDLFDRVGIPIGVCNHHDF